jgi:hypothetical protein
MRKSKSIRRKSRRYRKSRKNRTRRNYPSFKRTGGQIESVKCCMCEKNINGKTLVPLSCLQNHGEKAHRICEECWWDPKMGFAREDAPHGCPGCLKGLPLSVPQKRLKPKIEDIIVLSDDD